MAVRLTMVHSSQQVQNNASLVPSSVAIESSALFILFLTSISRELLCRWSFMSAVCLMVYYRSSLTLISNSKPV